MLTNRRTSTLLLLTFTPTYTPFGYPFAPKKDAQRHLFFVVQLSVPQAEREASFGCEAHLRRVKCAYGTIYGTLNFTLCEAQHFTAASPLLHLGIAQTSLNFVYQTNVVFFELIVPCGTISTPSVREVMFRFVKCLRATFTSCVSTILHSGIAAASLVQSPNFTECCLL